MKEMILSLKKAVTVTLLAFCLPIAVNGQTTSLTFDVQPDVPQPGFTQVDVLVWTSLGTNTFGSATIDVLFDPVAVSYVTKQSLAIGDTNTANIDNCNAVGDIFLDCPAAAPYGTHSVDPAGSGAVRLTITSEIKLLTGLTLDYAMVGLETGSSQGTASPIARLIFQDTPTAAAKSSAKFSSFVPADTSLSIGFYSSINNSDSTFTIDDQCAAAPCTFVDSQLPVELSEFTAVIDQEDVVLNWTTASELNNAGFSIEHASGAETEFSELTFIEGKGTTTDQQVYSFRTAGLDIGTHRFRLRQIDFDGAFEYSDEVEAVIELAGTHRLGAAYPNPFNPSTTFELIVGKEQQVRIDVINALGQRVQRMFDGPMEANEPTNFVFDARMLPTGLYFYRVVGENFMQTRQMLLVK